MILTPAFKRAAAVAICLTAAPLAACASGGSSNAYSDELARLTEDCRARGGILTPNAAQVSGAPERDFACKINGEPSSRTR